MSDQKSGISQVGTQADPIALSATGGPTEIGTWTHGNGQRAIAVNVYNANSGAAIPDASVTATQPDTNSIVLTNTTAGALNVIAIITWEIPSPGATGIVPESAVVLS